MRTVLHVLPHPGGGGERYVDTLARMGGYRFERVYLAPSPSPRDARRALPRTVWSAFRLADLLHVHGEVAAAICLPALALRSSIVTFHGLNLLRRSTGLRHRVATANLRLVVHAASAAICVAETEAADVEDALGRRRNKNIIVIPNGVDIPDLPDAEECAAARAGFGVSDEAVVGAWIGGLDAVKDPLTAVRAASAAATSGVPFVLLVAGEGPLLASIRAAASVGPIGSVSMLGYQSDIRRVLAAADIFVLSSVREGLSYSLLDAMALARPAIVSDVPGNVEAVGPEGVDVAPGDVAGFSAAIVGLATDSNHRHALGLRARSRVQERFSAGEMVARTRELYDRVLERSS